MKKYWDYHEHPSHGWISPHGKFYYTKQHIWFAKDMLPASEVPYDELMDLGWVALTHDSVQTSATLRKRQLRTAKRLIVGDDKGYVHLADMSINLYDYFLVPVWWFKKSKTWREALSGTVAEIAEQEKYMRELWLERAERERMGNPRMRFRDVPHVDFPDAEQMNVHGVYLIHMDVPFKHAQHYTGWGINIAERVQHHLDMSGAAILRAAVKAGINFVVARIWPCQDWHFEKALKKAKQPRLFCPICAEQYRLKMSEYMRVRRKQKT